MQNETKNCQNCKNDFTIEPEDFDFYEKIKAPPPTFCHQCRLQRRLAFRNERNLYKRNDSRTGENIISTFSSDKNMNVYEQHYWFSDAWDPMEFGLEYDFTKSFFAQMKDLICKVPFPSLNNWNAVNTEYANFATDNKNCYFVFGGDFNENCLYSTYNFHCKDSAELYWVNKSEVCAELIDSEGNFNSTNSQYIKSCVNTSFSFNLTGCNDCIGCINLRNKGHYIFNQPYTKEDYDKKISEFNLGSYSNLQLTKKKFSELYKNAIFRPYRFVNTTNCTGDNIFNSKNCFYCFDVFGGAENCRYIYLIADGVKDSHSCDHIGLKSELCYESASIYPASNVICSWIIRNSHNIFYSIGCKSSSNLFGCIGLDSKQYCIFNRQYSKEEYENLIPKIIHSMTTLPYKDSRGLVYSYGDFFPIELSPYSYNETVAQEVYPMSKEECLQKNLSWKDLEDRNYKVTIKSTDLPDSIKDTDDSITNETIACEHSTIDCHENCITAFRILPEELKLYRRIGLALPRLCPNCRHYQKVKQRNLPVLWKRSCSCDVSGHDHTGKCTNEFNTTYAPDRPEIVYCEKCYQQEVY